ncbi:MAG: glycogen synthase [Oscillospiraceae bacterium]|nr:glycogen synthase [Oscillospiraceae bacterium]
MVKAIVTKKKQGRNILFAVSEAVPFLATGGMGQVAGALTAALHEAQPDYDIRMVLPLYGAFRERNEPNMTFLGETTVTLAWRQEYCGVFEMVQDGITYYFVDNRRYFDREKAYGHFDDGERFAYFSKAVFAVMEFTEFVPDVIHAHDWQTALVPIYLKAKFTEQHPALRTVFTIHNLEYQGKFAPDILTDVFDLPASDAGLVEYDNCINLMKGAIVTADKITTVSPSYAEEIQHGGGFGLEPIIRENAYKLSGIINGIDTKTYNPETDTLLAKNYTAKSLAGKAVNKKKLQEVFGLPQESDKMLLCLVSRLVSHKGIDLITYIMDDLLQLDVQFLLLGTGETQYELFFEEQAIAHPRQVGVNIAYHPELAGLIYAGADVMLMPSRSEPCGLTQMIACRYGAIPIVRKTGGLGDTITDCRTGDGNGFVFEEYDAMLLLDTIREALDLYQNHPADWENLMGQAMQSDFGWDVSARAYVALYEGL